MEDQPLNKVRLKVNSWIALTLGKPEQGNYTLSREVKPGTTVTDFFTELAQTYPEFSKSVFNLETGKPSNQVLVILNNRLVQFNGQDEIVLKDQDAITITPILFGG